MKCILCGSEALLYCRQLGKNIFRCESCGLGITDKVAVTKSQYHRDDDYLSQSIQFANIFSKRVNLVTNYQKKGKVLEIGSSTGLMLSLFKDLGWHVEGVEVSPKAVIFAEKLGIKTINKPIERLHLPADSFDVVILNHTLEHLEDPIGILKKIHKILKKNGLILISVPNFDGFSSRVYHCRWPLLLPLEHRWHFSKLSLQKLLHQNDFSVLHLETDSGIFDYGNPLLELIQSGIGLKKRFIKEFLTLIPDFIVSKTGLGSGQIVIARKR